MIQQVERFTVRHYRDNGQTAAICEWIDNDGTSGTTTGFLMATCHHCPGPHFGTHMTELAKRAIREGIAIETEIW